MTPELTLPPDVREQLIAVAGSLEADEGAALAAHLSMPSSLHGFGVIARTFLREVDHVVVRGVPPDDGGALMRIAALVGSRFKPYHGRKVVKRFRMSPWTQQLSHTTQAGHFHTDINTAEMPPAITAIQCVVPDPGAPEYGRLFVTRLPDLLAEVRRRGEQRTLAFLTEDEVTMVNDSSHHRWTGTIVRDETLRYHPVTLMDAQRRLGDNPKDLVECLGAIHEAAMAVAESIDLGAGDVLLVSNWRALHRRGACTAMFKGGPTDFVSREVNVLHLMAELP